MGLDLLIWNVQKPGPSAEERGKGLEALQECEGLHFSLGLELSSESRRTGLVRLLLLRRDTMSELGNCCK